MSLRTSNLNRRIQECDKRSGLDKRGASDELSEREEKLALFNELCAQHPHLIRESLLVFKTWIRIGNKHHVPYLDSTLEQCLEWFQTKV